MVEGIDRDRISDITTNLIREPLIHYTQDMCRHYGMPLVNDVASGPLWSPTERRWTNGTYVKLPRTPTGRLMLVPKTIVRRKLDFDPRRWRQSPGSVHVGSRRTPGDQSRGPLHGPETTTAPLREAVV